MNAVGGRDAVDIEYLHRLGLIPVVEIDSLREAEPLLAALVEAGLPAVEITLRTPIGIDAIKMLRERHPDALVGAGTVRSAASAQRALDAGAQFIVSPTTNLDVISVCREADVLVIAGACTPTEIETALSAGAPIIKLFPAEAMGGVAYLKALTGPFPEVRFIPTGGINSRNLADYLRVPQVVACGGSWIVTPSLLRVGAYAKIRELGAEAVEIVAQARADV